MNNIKPKHFLRGLTEREIKILTLVAKGYSNNKISEILSISNGTVRNHLCSIYKKLNVKSRVQAILKGKEESLI